MFILVLCNFSVVRVNSNECGYYTVWRIVLSEKCHHSTPLYYFYILNRMQAFLFPYLYWHFIAIILHVSYSNRCVVIFCCVDLWFCNDLQHWVTLHILDLHVYIIFHKLSSCVCPFLNHHIYFPTIDIKEIL